jgi:hypothetical protein
MCWRVCARCCLRLCVDCTNVWCSVQAAKHGLALASSPMAGGREKRTAVSPVPKLLMEYLATLDGSFQVRACARVSVGVWGRVGGGCWVGVRATQHSTESVSAPRAALQYLGCAVTAALLAFGTHTTARVQVG